MPGDLVHVYHKKYTYSSPNSRILLMQVFSQLFLRKTSYVIYFSFCVVVDMKETLHLKWQKVFNNIAVQEKKKSPVFAVFNYFILQLSIFIFRNVSRFGFLSCMTWEKLYLYIYIVTADFLIVWSDILFFYHQLNL